MSSPFLRQSAHALLSGCFTSSRRIRALRSVVALSCRDMTQREKKGEKVEGRVGCVLRSDLNPRASLLLATVNHRPNATIVLIDLPPHNCYTSDDEMMRSIT